MRQQGTNTQIAPCAVLPCVACRSAARRLARACDAADEHRSSWCSPHSWLPANCRGPSKPTCSNSALVACFFAADRSFMWFFASLAAGDWTRPSTPGRPSARSTLSAMLPSSSIVTVLTSPGSASSSTCEDQKHGQAACVGPCVPAGCAGCYAAPESLLLGSLRSRSLSPAHRSSCRGDSGLWPDPCR